jgi:hypothetical protein
MIVAVFAPPHLSIYWEPGNGTYIGLSIYSTALFDEIRCNLSIYSPR